MCVCPQKYPTSHHPISNLSTDLESPGQGGGFFKDHLDCRRQKFSVFFNLLCFFQELLTSKSDYPVKIHLMIHEYVLFSSRLAAYAYAQVHDECWPVFDKRIGMAVTSGKTIGNPISKCFFKHQVALRPIFKAALAKAF